MVNVYSNADEIELFQEGVSLGRKPVSEETKYFASFETTYRLGKLEAMCYRDGAEDGRDELVTAAEAEELCAGKQRSDCYGRRGRNLTGIWQCES